MRVGPRVIHAAKIATLIDTSGRVLATTPPKVMLWIDMARDLLYPFPLLHMRGAHVGRLRGPLRPAEEQPWDKARVVHRPKGCRTMLARDLRNAACVAYAIDGQRTLAAHIWARATAQGLTEHDIFERWRLTPPRSLPSSLGVWP